MRETRPVDREGATGSEHDDDRPNSPVNADPSFAHAPTAPPAGAQAITLPGGTALWLLPQRAVWWPAARTAFVADVHFGKAATFRRAGQPVPHGTTAANLRIADSQRRQSQQRGQCRHHDRPQAVATGLQDCLVSRQAGRAQIDHVRAQHDTDIDHDADQHHEADHGHHRDGRAR